MSVIRMRGTISPGPRCDQHKQYPMQPVFLFLDGGARCMPAFACAQVGCQRLYSIVDGYHTISDAGQIEPSTQQIDACPSDGSARYLTEHDAPMPGQDRYRWACAQFRCGG